MSKFAWCPALLVMAVLTTPADGSGLWDRFKASLPAVAGESSFAELPEVRGAQYIDDGEYVAGESSTVMMPDELEYTSEHLNYDGYGYGYDSSGCTQCKGYTCPCTKCFRYLSGMWNRLSLKRRSRGCCEVETQCGATECCEPRKRGCCFSRLFGRLPWRLRLDNLWCKANGSDTHYIDGQWSDAQWTDEAVIDDYRELPGQPAPAKLEAIPSTPAVIDDAIGPTASVPRPAGKMWWRTPLQNTRSDWAGIYR